jgi:hypothetical protein
MKIRRLAVAMSLGGALLGATNPAVFAQGQDGDSASSAAASGVDGGLVTTGDYSMEADRPTTVAVGGDANLGVPQPDLARVPAGSGDGIFNVISAPVMSQPAVANPNLAPAPAPSESIASESAVAADSYGDSYGETVSEAASDSYAEGDSYAADEAASDTYAEADSYAAGQEVASEAAYVAGCSDFGSWYEAQVALENTGDPALIESLDPDYNGVACEIVE